MRIGYDGKRIFHNFRGLGNYSRLLVESMLKFYEKNEYFLFTPPFKNKRSLQWHEDHQKAKVIGPRLLRGGFSSSLWRSFLLSSEIKKKKLDLYHGLSHELPLGLGKMEVRSVVTIHDLLFMRYPQFFPWIDRLIYRKKFSLSIEMADIVVAISQQTRNDLIEILHCPEEKIRVIHQSCSPRFYSRWKEKSLSHLRDQFHLGEQGYILYVGAFEKRKNIISLIKAFSRLRNHIPHDLVLVGRGSKEYCEEMEKEIINLGSKKRVKIFNGVSDSQLPGLYQGADLFVLPSFSEGWGIPIVEALFSETPVLTSKGASFVDPAGPSSLFADPTSIEDIAEKIEKVVLDKALQREMALKGRQYAEQFHWKNTSGALMKVYREIL